MTRSRLLSDGVLFCFTWHHLPGQVVLRKLPAHASAGLTFRALSFPCFQAYLIILAHDSLCHVGCTRNLLIRCSCCSNGLHFHTKLCSALAAKRAADWHASSQLWKIIICKQGRLLGGFITAAADKLMQCYSTRCCMKKLQWTMSVPNKCHCHWQAGS